MDEMFDIFTDPLEDMKRLSGKESKATKPESLERKKQWKRRYSRKSFG